METFHVNVCGQNVNLSIDSRLYDPRNRSVLGPYDYFARGEPSDWGVTLLYGKRRRVFQNEDYFQLTHYRGKAGSHIIRQILCHIVAYHWRTMDLLHATGLVVDSRRNKGVLLVGRAHCGKTTLSRSLNYTIMDDDIMMVSDGKMRVAGKMGFVTYVNPDSGRKYLTPLPSGVKEVELSLVVILDKQEQGGKFGDIDNRIQRKFAVPDDLPAALQKAYMRLPPIRVDAPIYRLGTRGRLPETVATLRHIISQHI